MAAPGAAIQAGAGAGARAWRAAGRVVACLLCWLGLIGAVVAAEGHAAPAWAGLGSPAPAWAGSAPALVLDDRRPDIAAWPAVRLLSDPEHRLSRDQALQRRPDFRPPGGPAGNLGVRRDTVWLLLPLQVAQGDGQWLLNIDYPPLNDLRVTLLRDGMPVLERQLGNLLPYAERPVRARPHALRLALEPGVRYELLLRVQTTSSMVLPISLVKPDAFQDHESSMQLQQGLLIGVAVALLLYSLSHWVSLREALFLYYAVLLVGVTTFFIAYFGIGQQHLWSEQSGALDKIAPQAILLALAGGGLFVAGALRTRERNPWTHRGLLAVAALSALGLVASLAGALDYRLTQATATLLGPLPMLIAIPAAYRLARSGDRGALFLLLGWSAYMAGALCIAGLLRGLLPVTYWTQHLFQLASVVEMVVWTRILALRIEGVRRDAERTEVERQALESLAYTDALTGLPNRRGLNQALAAALAASRADARAGSERVLAVFLLDLDGFKPVNDRLGHDAGDELLVQVGQRLKRNLRHSDLVARLGGDEFVIVASGLAGEAEAQLIGRKLLDAFRQPFAVAGQSCHVGLTIGFALAPHDGHEADDLLKRADAAMYAGKQAGRHTLRRGQASQGLT
ncbi:diguanylate cyclase domain-containing protein [Aquabacterium sp. OR-4]|uniref:diguanylate cyclase domain-containing protein n=1 Tax=Aquabacterium sp. OR-4 TaxID=2978127 RepID=UPI0021B2B9FC|nr:diguanylate cyclase [Aquabacterium sp. OR-4]MDT7837605.1 diguanylate cyclase [Aquabacterium sp. OR-4]